MQGSAGKTLKNANPRQFSTYAKLYPKSMEHTQFHLEDEASFKYCTGRQFFVLIIAYTSDGHVLLERAFSPTGLKWSIPGGGLRPFENEDFLYAAHRLASSYGEDLKLADITPFAFLENNFAYEGQHHTHRGIGFIGRLRNNEDAKLVQSSLEDRGYLVPLSQLRKEDVYPLHNAEVIPLAKEMIERRLENLVTDFDSEITSTEEMKDAYKRHAKYVKPVVKFISNSGFALKILSLFYQQEFVSKNDFDEKILSIIKGDNDKSFIDVACGESPFCSELASGNIFECVVANDVAFNQIGMIEKSATSGLDNLIYTNHDARNMPFSDDTFDVGFVKNVLHHIPSRDGVVDLITEAARVAKKFVVVEINDPQNSYFTSRKLNDYFVHCLKDDYEEFYNEEQFRSFFESIVKEVDIFQINTVQGAYNIAVVGSD